MSEVTIPEDWERLEKEHGDRLLAQLQKRDWKRLHSRYGERFGFSYEEFVKWGKWVVSSRKGTEEAKPEEEKPEKVELKQFITDKRVWYDEEADVYTTYLPGEPHALAIPGSIHREICRAYSNYDSNPASVNELSRTFKLPRNTLTKYLRVHGITHDREPFTPEEIMSRSEDDLAEEALQIRRAAIYRRIEGDRWKEVRKDAAQWRNFDDTLFREFLSLMSDRPDTPPTRLDLKPTKRPYAAVIGLSDFHWGKYSDAGENWEQFDREIAAKRLFDCTEEVLSRMAQFGAPEKLYVPVGSDFFQIDNQQGTTTRGTVQDMDGTPAEILVSGCEFMVSWVNRLRQVCPVELVLMSGNHDRHSGLALLLYLDAYYRTSIDVTVNRTRTPRVYTRYGENLIGFVHGDKVGKTKDLAGLMAREAKEDWSANHRTIYTGHLHYEKTETDVSYGVTRRQLPSLSGPDRWHAASGYVGAPKSLPVYLHDKDKGLVAVIHGPAD